MFEVACDEGHRIFIDDGAGGVYACPACKIAPLPSVEALADALAGEGIDALPGEPDLTGMAERLLALLPRRDANPYRKEARRD